MKGLIMKKFKKSLCILLSAFMIMATLTGCFDNSKRKELENYIDVDLKKFSEEELQITNDMMQAVSLLNSGNYIPSANYIKETILPECKAMQDEVSALTFEDAELQSIHQIYIDYMSDYIVALNYLCKGLEQENMSQINNAEAKLNDCNGKVEEYKQKLIEYAKQNNMKITFLNENI